MKLTLNDLFEATYPTRQPSANLLLRARLVALAANRRAQRRLLFARVMKAGGVLGAIAAIGLVIPSARAVVTARWLEGRLSDVKSARIEIVTMGENGHNSSKRTVFYDDGKWRLEGMGQTLIYKGGIMYSMREGSQEATAQPADGPFGKTQSGLSMKAMFGDFARWGWNRKVEISRGVQTDQGTRDRYLLTEEGRTTQEVFYVDTATDLPTRVELRMWSGEGWKVGAHVNYSYDLKLAGSLFETPKNISNPALSVATLAKSNLATVPLQRGNFVLRDVSVTNLGHVIVLFTADSQRHAGWSPFCFRVTDNLGTKYTSMSFSPSDEFQNQRRGFWVGDLPVHGEWLVPLEFSQAWRPRKLKIEFATSKGKMASVVGWFSVAPDGTRTLHEPNWSGYDMHTVFEKELAQPTCGEFPELLAKSISVWPSELLTLHSEGARLHYYRQREDWPKVARHGEAWLQAADVFEANGHGPWSRYRQYLDLYLAYKALGKTEIARDYLRRSNNSSREFPDKEYEDALAKALRDEGL